MLEVFTVMFFLTWLYARYCLSGTNTLSVLFSFRHFQQIFIFTRQEIKSLKKRLAVFSAAKCFLPPEIHSRKDVINSRLIICDDK